MTSVVSCGAGARGRIVKPDDDAESAGLVGGYPVAGLRRGESAISNEPSAARSSVSLPSAATPIPLPDDAAVVVLKRHRPQPRRRRLPDDAIVADLRRAARRRRRSARAARALRPSRAESRRCAQGVRANRDRRRRAGIRPGLPGAERDRVDRRGRAHGEPCAPHAERSSDARRRGRKSEDEAQGRLRLAASASVPSAAWRMRLFFRSPS